MQQVYTSPIEGRTTANTTGPDWGLAFTYDGFGNRTTQSVSKSGKLGCAESANYYSRGLRRVTAVTGDRHHPRHPGVQVI